MMRLGETQIAVLRSLVEEGCWHGGCGWTWNGYAGTVKVLDSLARRGLAVREDRKHPQFNLTEPRFTPSEAGIAYANKRFQLLRRSSSSKE